MHAGIRSLENVMTYFDIKNVYFFQNKKVARLIDWGRNQNQEKPATNILRSIKYYFLKRKSPFYRYSFGMGSNQRR